MIKKRLAITIIIITGIIITAVLLPTFLFAANDNSQVVTRLYADELSGPWSANPSENTRWVEKITVFDSQTTIVIQEVSFMWEAPQGTLVYVGGTKGEQGPEGPQGPKGTFPFLNLK